MNDILSEEQQQIESIKNWIKENYLSLIAAIAVFCAIVFGPDLYQSYKNSRIFPASDMYQSFSEAVSQATTGAVATDAELQRVDALVDQLIEQHAESHYAFLASLGAAKLSADLGNYPAALARLRWAESNTGNQADQQLVNHRLALVEAQSGDTDSALARLAAPNAHFAALYAETKGDIYASLGEREQAIGAYEESLEVHTAQANLANTRSLELKLNSLLSGVGSLAEAEAQAPSTEDEPSSEEAGAE